MFKHVALPLHIINQCSSLVRHILKVEEQLSNGKRLFFGWRRLVIVQKMHIASYATLQLYQGTVVSKLMNHEKT